MPVNRYNTVLHFNLKYIKIIRLLHELILPMNRQLKNRSKGTIILCINLITKYDVWIRNVYIICNPFFILVSTHKNVEEVKSNRNHKKTVYILPQPLVHATNFDID